MPARMTNRQLLLSAVIIVLVGIAALLPRAIYKLDAIAPADLLFAMPPWNVHNDDGIERFSNVLSDQFDWVHPTYQYAVNSLRSLKISAYTPLIGNGTPFGWVAIHLGVNPLAVTLGYILGAASGFTIYTLTKLCIGAFSIMWLLRSYGITPWATIWAAIVLCFSSTTITALGIPMSDQMMLIVAGLATIRHGMLKPSAYSIALIGIVGFFLLITPYPPGTLAAGALLVLFTLSELLQYKHYEHKFYIILATLICGAILAILLALPILYETFNFFFGGGESYDTAYRKAQYPREAITKTGLIFSFFPHALGLGPNINVIDDSKWFYTVNYFTSAAWFGVGLSFFALLKDRRLWFFSFAAIFYVLICFNTYHLNSNFIAKIPGFDSIRAYSHIYAGAVCIIIAAAIGLNFLSKQEISKRLLVSGIVTSLILTAILVGKSITRRKAVTQAISDNFELLLPYIASSALLFTLLICLIYFKRRYFRTTLVGLILLLSAGELWHTSLGINRTTPREAYYPATSEILYLKESIDTGKVLPLANTLLAATHLPFDIASLGWRGFMPKDVMLTFNEFLPGFSQSYSVSQRLYPADGSADLDHPFINVMGVKFLTVPRGYDPFDKVEHKLIRRSKRAKLSLTPKMKLAHGLYIPKNLVTNAIRLHFVNFPTSTSLSVQIKKESNNNIILTNVINKGDLSELNFGGYIDLKFPILNFDANDKLIIEVENLGNKSIDLMTYWERDQRDTLQVNNFPEAIGAIAVDILQYPDAYVKTTTPFKKVLAGGMDIWENIKFNGRVHATFKCHALPRAEQLAFISNERPDLTREVVLENCRATNVKGKGKIKTVYNDSDFQVYNVQMSGPGYFVIGDNYHPAWQAMVDGKNATIEQADFNLRAIYLPTGTHEVKMTYTPKGMNTIILIAIIMWCCVLIIILMKAIYPLKITLPKKAIK